MNNSSIAIMMVKNGFQCSQAVLAALGEQLGVERKQALRLATGFGGGIALQGDICGAVSGAIMAIGLKHGYDDDPDVDAKHKTFFLAQELIQRIKAKHGCYTCGGLTGMEWTVPGSIKLFYEQGIPERVCHNVIRDAVEIVEEIW